MKPKYSFSRNSKAKLNTCHKDLQLIMSEAIKVSPLDFGIAEGHRTLERQQYLYEKGFSRIDGVKRKGKHNHNPSLAVDIFPWTRDINGNFGISYNQQRAGLKDQKQVTLEFALIVGCILSTAERLLQEKKVSHRLVSGADWDADALFEQDHNFIDWPHLELRKV